MRKNPELLFTTESLIPLLLLALAFRAGGSRDPVNRTRGLEFVQLQELNHYFSFLSISHSQDNDYPLANKIL